MVVRAQPEDNVDIVLRRRGDAFVDAHALVHAVGMAAPLQAGRHGDDCNAD